MENLNQVQRYLYSFGYPRSIVKEYKTGTEHYREEVKDYARRKKIQNNREEDAVCDKVLTRSQLLKWVNTGKLPKRSY